MISLWLFVGFVSLCCRQATTKSTGDDIQPAVQLSGKSRWNLVKDKHQHAEKSFIKPLEKKPTLERVSTVISQSQSLGKIPKVDQRSKPRLPSINANRQANTSRSVFTMETVCSPERYIVRLRHGNCTRIVETTMCYGFCKSYTLPVSQAFHSAATARHSLANACQCCTARLGATRAAPHDVTCDIGGEQSKKTFYVPIAKTCECRQCVVNY
ncbi:uncharacterized protein LOC134180437 [Corticium candelabrum]|uniref:uncharacterized protein LOC134180437 n=1 Tax=Corticium candelabrum TaxID=121492 RepID=UPI002E25531A|nr:uncharacterized protein LOC134180437 [Corticium candelabrum]